MILERHYASKLVNKRQYMKKKYIITSIIVVLFALIYTIYMAAIVGMNECGMYNMLLQLGHLKREHNTSDIHNLIDYAEYGLLEEPPISFQLGNLVVLRPTPFATLYIHQKHADDDILYIHVIRQPYPFFPFITRKREFKFDFHHGVRVFNMMRPGSWPSSEGGKADL